MKRAGRVLLCALLFGAGPANGGVHAAQPSVGAIQKTGAAPPNVLIWMIDDLGFAQIGAYGGVIDTPNIDRLARRGLRYTDYRTTPVCSASRAALLTGRNSHTAHIGGHSAVATDYPGYDALVPRGAGTIAANLQAQGYLTYAIGKWDHLPPRDASASGPFTYWPSGQGFDRYYGFLSFDANNFRPVLWNDHQPAALPNDPGYHLTSDMADRAIEWIASRQSVSPAKPFFLYWATGAVHSPHQAPASYIQRYRGRFDGGWDEVRSDILRRQKGLGLVPPATVLPPLPAGLLAWDSLSPDEKRMHARAMEVFAAQLTHADQEFGRMLDALEQSGELDNTMVIVTSDNGASAEGGPNGAYNEHLFFNGRFASVADNLKNFGAWGTQATYPHYSAAWAVAGNTPFRYYKQTAFEGGIHVPLIVSWPRGIAAQGELRTQFTHVSDLAPTILESAGLAMAKQINGVEQMPFDGISMAYSFADAKAQTPRKVQYFEMFGNRAIWADGWKAVVPHRVIAWDMMTSPPISDKGWELYNLRRDVNETTDLARAEPERLRSMIALFDREARTFNVYPLQNTADAQKANLARQAEEVAARGGLWLYTAAISNIPEALAPPIQTRSFTVEAEVELRRRANGTIFAVGGSNGGMALHLVQGTPIFSYRNIDLTLTEIAGERPLQAGRQMLRLDFQRGSEGAEVSLSAGGTIVARGHIRGELPILAMAGNESFDVGSEAGSKASPRSRSDAFEGRIRRLRVQLPAAR